jgi:hypothetical protein
MGMLMVTYPISRFLIEYLRDDEGAFFAGLTISQNLSVVLLLAGVVFWAWLLRQPKALYRDQLPLTPHDQEAFSSKASALPLREVTSSPVREVSVGPAGKPSFTPLRTRTKGE